MVESGRGGGGGKRFLALRGGGDHRGRRLGGRGGFGLLRAAGGTRFYDASRGGLYCDPSYGVAAARRGNEERRQFYFGCMDTYRMAANRVFQAPFTVEKAHWRGDPYDNQVGELETTDRGFRYDEFERDREVLSWEEG